MIATMHAGGPVRSGDSYKVTFYDDFIFELCGIDAFTTLIERWSLKEFTDGSATLHVNRTAPIASASVADER